MSAQAHRGQKRQSGDDYVSHSVAVATILAEQQMDSVTIAAALLHDVVEDSDVAVEDIRRTFGPEVAELVDGLTKLSTLTFRSTVEEQAENYRKLLLSVAKDARVIIIKLADRLHNMRTLEHLDPEKRRRIALETREIYAPLAHRFGMAGVKAELEDLACKFLEPEDYRALARKVKARKSEREETIERLRIPLAEELRTAGLTGFEITGRPKNLWSIYKKMKKRDKTFEEIYDLLAVRVLVNDIPECYHVLGVIHHKWTPLQERIKDYIASPKSNGYQSLHTTVFGPGGQLYEIQIRTHEMHHTAEYGIAAHWLFKEGRKSPDELDRHLAWFRQLLELQQDAHTPEEFLEFLKVDLYQDEIFVFTPRGDVKRLPKGATPIDFAFAVHTEVGQHCQGARINGRIAPLHRPLKNGDTVEVMTSPQAKPSRDWLAHVQTARARHKIRQWISREEHEKSLELGQEILAREVRRRRLQAPDAERLERVATELSVGTAEKLQAALGRGGPARPVCRHLHRHQRIWHQHSLGGDLDARRRGVRLRAGGSREPDPLEQGDPGDPAGERCDGRVPPRVGPPDASPRRLTFFDAVRPRIPVRAGGAPAACHPRAGRGPRTGRSLPDAAGRHRLRQDDDHGARHRRVRAPHARVVPQQDPGRPALRRAQGVLPEEP